jgi:hypothetical protein
VDVVVVGDGDGDDPLPPRWRLHLIECSAPLPDEARRYTRPHGRRSSSRRRSSAGLTDFEVVAVAVAVNAHVNDE